MRFGDADGLEEVYDEEGQLILAERERMYGRRGLTIDAYEVGFLSRKPLVDMSLWMVYYTNQRVVGLRDMTEREEEVYLGTLRPIDRSRFMGPQADAHCVMKYFEFPTKDIERVKKSGKKCLSLFLRGEDHRYEFRFRPWGAACRFFSVLLRKEE